MISGNQETVVLSLLLPATTADYLIGISGTWKGSKGPSGKVRQVFEQVSKLPRRQQQKIVEVVEAFVHQKAAGL